MVSKLKLEIEKKLYYNDVSFSTKVRKFDDQVQVFFITNDQIGILVYHKGKVKYFVADCKKIQWAIDEGFSEEEINKKFLLYTTAKTIDSFVNKLSQKKPKRKKIKAKVKKK